MATLPNVRKRLHVPLADYLVYCGRCQQWSPDVFHNHRLGAAWKCPNCGHEHELKEKGECISDKPSRR
jgi:hypothetical protein